MPNPRLQLSRDKLKRLLDGYPVQAATAEGVMEFEGVPEPPWQPLRKLAVPAHMTAHHASVGADAPDVLWANDEYEVGVTEQESGITHLSVKRYDRAPIHNWRHLQQIKNEICGELREGMELYPSEARLADNANQTHLWVLPEDMEIPVGWPNGMVLVDDEEVETFNRAGGKGRQEPMQAGLTVGKGLNDARTPEQTRQIRELLPKINNA